MSTPPGGGRTAVVRRRAIAPLACLLLAGCAVAQHFGAAPLRTVAPVDWLNRTYSVTCDGVVPTGLPATVVDGHARVPADGSRAPFYDHYVFLFTAAANGDVDGDG